MHIDEAGRRRSDFAEGQPLVLADGQVWHLRLPRLLLSPVFDGHKVVEVACGRDGVPDYEELSGVLLGEVPADRRAYWLAVFTAGAYLLRSNYELSDAELSALLTWRARDPECEGRVEVIEGVFLGNIAPKPGPGGSS